jgi:8-oxo-dGTP pyrophosphatase MutT (NUDIX family)
MIFEQVATSSQVETPSQKPHQCGALCWKPDENGNIEVLLVTSRRTGRWVIPKGNLKKREARHECARREAYEEAGVTGKIGKKTIGRYAYFKQERQEWLTVSVYPLQVIQQEDEFPEMDFRQRLWLPAEKAATCLEEPDLRRLCELLLHPGKFQSSGKDCHRDRR